MDDKELAPSTTKKIVKTREPDCSFDRGCHSSFGLRLASKSGNHLMVIVWLYRITRAGQDFQEHISTSRTELIDGVFIISALSFTIIAALHGCI